MSRYLLLDVGAGTLDVLFFDDASGLNYRAVVRSPVLYTAEYAQKITGDVLVTGVEMGGGSLFDVLSEHSKQARVVVTSSASRTLSHNPERIQKAGIDIIEDDEAEKIEGLEKYARLDLSDIPRKHIEKITESLGVPFEFDVVGVCAQDHGMPPEGKSHLDFRHEIMRKALDVKPSPEVLLYGRENVPYFLNRLKSIAETAVRLPCREVYVMDSGMAAILGASMDFQLRGAKRSIVLDIATSHTVCAAIEDGEVAGIVEYHTKDLTLKKLESLMVDLAEGRLVHRQVLAEGGHGAYIRKAFGFKNVEFILATGPKRRLVEKSGLPISFGSPFGDNMMTGTTGLLEAIRRQKGLDFFLYL